MLLSTGARCFPLHGRDNGINRDIEGREMRADGVGDVARCKRARDSPAVRPARYVHAGSIVQSQTWMRGLYQMPRYPSQTGAPRVQ
jgi:hypothetical protein